MATLPQALFETLVISLGRASLFYACRHYLLRSLYHDLRHLSSPSLDTSLSPRQSIESVPHSSDTELNELPQPATTPRTPSEPSAHFKQTGVERTWHSSLARMTFSLCFSESCTLFLLVLGQATEIFSPRARYINWRISLGLLVTAILLAAPLSQCVLLTYRAPSKGLNLTRRSFIPHFILTGIPFCIYLLLLSYIPLPSGLDTQDFTTTTLSRLVVLGTLILGILAGFGAVSAVFTHFQLSIASRDPVSESQIVAAEQALFRVRSDLLERRRQIERDDVTEPASEGGFLSRLNPFSGNPGDCEFAMRTTNAYIAFQELSSLRREIRGLEALEFQMSRNVEFLQRRHADSLFSGTFRGRVWGWVGRIFALYCAFRVVSSVINLISPFSSKTAVPGSTSSSPDLIAYLLAQIVSLVFPVSDADIAAASRQISLLLVGAIILSSVRRALRGVARLLKIASKNLGASLLMLLLAQLMGTYMLSTLIQLRTSFPTSPDTEEHLNLFATLPEYHVFGLLWDGAFLASVAISGGVRWFDERINGPNLG